jgi:L-2-amino-thiazoline-4-carboxylic acid hydrolase
MIYEFNQAISKLDEFKAEAQVLIPVLRAARTELGEEQANSLILGALRAWCRQRYRQIGADLPGSPREKYETLKELDGLRTRDSDLDFEILKWEPEAVEYDVSRCIYADFFRGLGEPELGAVLACDSDVYLVEEVTGPDVEYRRTQSIMEGGSFCDIRWRIKCDESRE